MKLDNLNVASLTLAVRDKQYKKKGLMIQIARVLLKTLPLAW